MPRGVYKRTKKQLEDLSKGRRLPRTKKQRESARTNVYKLHKLPRSLAQIENTRKMGKLPKTQAQREAGIRNLAIAPQIMHGDVIVKHHHDLCHGKLRPDDITTMTNSEHCSLHNNLRVEDGTNPFLGINRKK